MTAGQEFRLSLSFHSCVVIGDSPISFNFEGPNPHGRRNYDSRFQQGGVAQLGERLPCTQEVRSSSLLVSTTGQCPAPCHECKLGESGKLIPRGQCSVKAEAKTSSPKARDSNGGKTRFHGTKSILVNLFTQRKRPKHRNLGPIEKSEQRTEGPLKRKQVVRESCNTQRATTD